jgi:hypothetical protein
MNRNLISLFKDLIQHSTVHGLSHYERTKSSLIKLIWLVSILLSTSFCFYLVAQNIISYYDYSVTTRIDKVEDVPSKFPMITFCKLNLINNEFSKQTLDNYLDRIKYFENRPSFNSSTMELNFLSYISMMYFASPALTDEMRGKTGQPIDEFIVECAYNLKVCDYSYWKSYFDPTYGYCYQFNWNPDNILTVNRPNQVSALSLELFTGFSVDHFINCGEGVRVFISNPSITLINTDSKY